MGLPILFCADERLYSKADVVLALKDAGVVAGDTVMVHADIGKFGQLQDIRNRQQFTAAFVEAFLEVLGPTGTLVVPTFTYSYCNGESFDPATTPSTVGLFSEVVRTWPGARRSEHPIFSVAALGARAAEFVQGVGTSSFGKNSIFDRLVQANALYLTFGVDYFSCDLVHHLEQIVGVPYRYSKLFRGTQYVQGSPVETEVEFYVRQLDMQVEPSFDAIDTYLVAVGKGVHVQLGYGLIRAARCQDIMEVGKQQLQKNPMFFLKRFPAPEASLGNQMYDLVKRLYPLCRSLTGSGTQETLRIIQEYLPITFHSIPTGTTVYDWTVPKEWHITDAYIKNAAGKKVVDFRDSNLHVWNYSVPVHETMTLDALRPHLRTLPNHPKWIPYATTYYKEQWGFSLTHEVYEQLTEGMYEVVIESRLEPGVMTYGELVLPGTSSEEVLLSTYICHPSLCNDNLSGIALLTYFGRYLQTVPRTHTYRLLFIPETIGAIAWLATHEQDVERIRHGLVVTCVGDPGPFTYKKTRHGDRIIDRAVQKVLVDAGVNHSVVAFDPGNGSDERQYCSPGFDLPIGSLMRTMYARFAPYHTSADDLSYVTPQAMAHSLSLYAQVHFVLDHDVVYESLMQKGEPQLGRRGLYRQIGAPQGGVNIDERAIFWVVNYADGKHSLLDIAILSGISFSDIMAAGNACEQAGLFRRIAMRV